MTRGQVIGSRGHRLPYWRLPARPGHEARSPSEVRPEFTHSILDWDGLRRSIQQGRHRCSLRLSRWKLEHGIARTPG